MGSGKDIITQLRKLKELLTEGLITQEEYEDLRLRILADEFGPPLSQGNNNNNYNNNNSNNNNNNSNNNSNNNNTNNSNLNLSGIIDTSNNNNNNENNITTSTLSSSSSSSTTSTLSTSTLSLPERMAALAINNHPKLTPYNTPQFVPRQFEYHPTLSEYVVFGSKQGDVVILNQLTNEVAYSASTKTQTQIYALSWLHQEHMKFLAGSENGVIALYDVGLMQTGKYPISFTFPPFENLTSVHANCTDSLFVASGFSHDVALFDIHKGKQINTFKDAHSNQINVLKFANHDPNLFATSSFDRTVKLWDLRLRPLKPVYTRESERGNVMVVFSPDDRFLLASAVDNEVRQYTTGDGRLQTIFDIPKRRSSDNYTRSYYMNNGEYIIVGSSAEAEVRVYNAQTSRFFREISMSGLQNQLGVTNIQSLRGDPLIPFNFTVLLSNPSLTSSRLVRVSLVDS